LPGGTTDQDKNANTKNKLTTCSQPSLQRKKKQDGN